MATLYITQQGAVISKVSERLKVTLGEELLSEVPLIKISHVVVFGQVMLTAPARSLLMQRQIEICLLTQHGKYVGRIQPAVSKNVPLRIAQYKAMFDSERCLALARPFVLGKLSNLRMTLIRKGLKAGQAELKRARKQIKAALRGAQKATTLDELRGREGEGSAAYFAVFRHLLSTSAFTFESRTRRPPTDPVNALLSFGYTLLANELITAVNLVGFDPYIGYLHAPEYGRPALPLDLMEEFRPLIVDTMVASCLNQHLLSPDDFQQMEDGAWRLSDDGRRTFLQHYEARKQTEVIHPGLRQTMTYQRCFEQQARLFARVLQGELEEYPPLVMK
jgi:CRISPR-associated protein Cas1